MVGLVFVACGSNGTLTYSGGAVKNGNIGTEYYSNEVATATGEGSPSVSYKLKDSTLPKGLSLSTDGIISGTPTETAEAVKFTVVASASGFDDAEAEFTISILAAGMNSYTFEAALTDLDNVSGGGLSGNPIGKGMIVKGAAAANAISEYNGVKAFVGSMHKAGVSISYTITSDAAVEGKLKLSIGEDLAGAIHNWGPQQFEIKVNNGEAMSYTSFELYRPTASTLIEFELGDIGNINLIDGDNTITLTVLANTYYNGGTGGPALDCIQIETSAGLTWSPRTDNMS